MRVIAALTVEKLYNDTWKSNPYSGPYTDTIEFSPDSKIVAVGSASGIVRIWGVATGRNIATFSINKLSPSGSTAVPVTTLIFSPDGRTVVTNFGAGRLAAWDVASGRRLGMIRVRSGVFKAAAFASTGKLLVATENHSPGGHEIEIWSTTSR